MSATKISDLYDNFHTLIGNNLTGYTRIPNPYESDENPSLYLKKGYGIAFGPAQNTFRQICNVETLKRDFNIILINQVLSTQLSAVNRGAYEKTLLENHRSLIKAIAADDTLSNKAVKINFVGDSGIRYAESDTEKYIVIEMIFEIEYFESNA